MRQLIQERLKTLYGWPRRVAAVLCLLVAAASAIGGPAAHGSAAQPVPLRDRLPPGHVLVPVTLATRADFLREGDHVDLLAAAPDSATASEVGSGLLVIQVSQPASAALSAEGGTRLLVAASRPVAAKIAAAPPGRVVAVLDDWP